MFSRKAKGFSVELGNCHGREVGSGAKEGRPEMTLKAHGPEPGRQ